MSFLLVLAANAGDATGAAFGGLFAAVIGIFLLLLTAAWIAFPFIVISKANEILKLLRAIDANAAGNARIGNGVHQEIAKIREDTTKTLQWMVDNWPER
jgi:hypothetical protein